MKNLVTKPLAQRTKLTRKMRNTVVKTRCRFRLYRRSDRRVRKYMDLREFTSDREFSCTGPLYIGRSLVRSRIELVKDFRASVYARLFLAAYAQPLRYMYPYVVQAVRGTFTIVPPRPAFAYVLSSNARVHVCTHTCRRALGARTCERTRRNAAAR